MRAKYDVVPGLDHVKEQEPQWEMEGNGMQSAARSTAPVLMSEFNS